MSLLSSVSNVALERLRRIRSPRDLINLLAAVSSFVFVRPLRSLRIHFHVRHLHGPTAASLGPHDTVVLCLVRDGETLVQAFINHYLALGVERVVLMDNGSKDRTVEIASKHPQVTVLRCALPFGTYKNLLRRYLIYRFGQGRWSINVDMDELLEFPFSDRISLHDLVTYLNQHRYTAVVAYMVDMFARSPISEAWRPGSNGLRETYCYYDVSQVQDLPYTDHESGRHNDLANKGIPFRRGGIRKKVFGTDVVITKHPLIFMDGKLRPVPPHEVRNARIADFTCALLHYKFSPDFVKRIALALDERGYDKGSQQYETYNRILKEQPDLAMTSDQARPLRHVNDLVDQGFLIVSEAYRDWANEETLSPGRAKAGA